MKSQMKYQEINTKFHNKLQQLTHKKTRHICMYPNCEKLSINSHAISASSCLERISVDGILKTISVKRNDNLPLKEFHYDDIGIRESSTFKGFCHEHDAIFSGIDKHNINTWGDVFLQVYRSMCSLIFNNNMLYRASEETSIFKELFNPEHERKKLVSRELIARDMFELLNDVVGLEKKVSLKNNQTTFFSPFFENKPRDYFISYKKIDFACPVAFQTHFELNGDNGYYDSFILFTPRESGGDLFVISHNCDKKNISYHFRNELRTLSFIESCIMADSQFWISPIIYNAWSEEKREWILNDYYHYYERHYLDSYELSLFDETRFKLAYMTKDKLQAINELNKLSKVPIRASNNERNVRMMSRLMRDSLHKR